MSLLDGQYTYRGLTLGYGSDFGIRSVAGLEDLQVRAADQPLPRGHGAVPGPHYVAPKTVVLEVKPRAAGEALAVLLAQLRATFIVADEPLPLTWKRAGQIERLVYVRPIQLTHAETHETVGRLAFPKVALAAADPRIYSAAMYDVPLPLYSASGGGAEFSGDFPVDFASGASSDAVLTNEGAADAFPVLRFFGPTDGGTVTSVRVDNLTTGEALEIVTPIGPGQILTFDGSAWVTGSGRQVVGLDGASRYGSWQQPRLPLRLPPGDSVLRFTTTGTSTAVAAVASFRSTWLS